MITLLGSLLGFVGAALPDVLAFFRERDDRAHELQVLREQVRLRKLWMDERLEAVAAAADVMETRALYRTWRTHIPWVDALNGTVRPVLAYAFFALYCLVKAAQFHLMLDGGAGADALPWKAPVTLADALFTLWTPEDQAIFAGIISFYFGQRAMRKVRE